MKGGEGGGSVSGNDSVMYFEEEYFEVVDASGSKWTMPYVYVFVCRKKEADKRLEPLERMVFGMMCKWQVENTSISPGENKTDIK